MADSKHEGQLKEEATDGQVVAPQAGPGSMLAAASAGLGGRALARKIASRRVQRKAGAAAEAVEPQALVPAGGGAPLDGSTRSFMEPRIGHDFGDVRIHTGGEAARSAEALQARAYTAGQDIVFGAGEYAPGTEAGKHLLAHELTHVVQQRGASHAPQSKLEVSEPGDAGEQEADRVADAVMGKQGAGPIGGSIGAIARVARVQREASDEGHPLPQSAQGGAGASHNESAGREPDKDADSKEVLRQVKARLDVALEAESVGSCILSAAANVQIPADDAGAADAAPVQRQAVPGAPGAPGVPPAQPRPATMADVLKAIESFPSVKALWARLKDLVLKKLDEKTTTGEKVVTGVVAASIVLPPAVIGSIRSPSVAKFAQGVGMAGVNALVQTKLPWLNLNADFVGPNKQFGATIDIAKLLKWK